jgi:hypothetical protein
MSASGNISGEAMRFLSRLPRYMRAIAAAREKRLVVVGFTGKTGGQMAALCDCACTPCRIRRR